MKVKILTCIYSDLSGTEMGGRHSRGGHYRFSLLSLLKMSDADFLCYTSDREFESLKKFFYEENQISPEKLEIKVFDLKQTKHEPLFQKYKDYESAKTGDRCLEIQWAKFTWFWLEDGSYDYYFWFDAGLSHCGLIPNKYLTAQGAQQRYYESSLFNNDFLHNIIEDIGDKFLLLGKENDRNFWSGTVQPKWYKEYDRRIHIIGGLFGGKKETWEKVVPLFEEYAEKVTPEEKAHHEEVLMTLMYYNHKELFEKKDFDIWWCPDNCPPDTNPKLFTENKSFYRILEEFNRIYE
jgi:hypothetical protein